MSTILINNATIVNEGKSYKADLLIRDEIIEAIGDSDLMNVPAGTKTIEADGLLLLPGVIDDQVHFRQPGLTHKEIFTLNRGRQLPAVSPHSWICPIPVRRP